MKIIINFDIITSVEGERALAAFRNEEGEGWSVRFNEGWVECQSVPDCYWPRVFFGDAANLYNLEWRIIGVRHELWTNGIQLSEGMSNIAVPADGQLYVGSDPLLENSQWPHTVSVEVENGE